MAALCYDSMPHDKQSSHSVKCELFKGEHGTAAFVVGIRVAVSVHLAVYAELIWMFHALKIERASIADAVFYLDQTKYGFMHAAVTPSNRKTMHNYIVSIHA